MTALRLVVAGSPAAAVPTLDALAAGPHEIVRVITRPASPLGRKRILTPTPMAQAAERHGIPVVEAARLADVQDQLLALEVDLAVIVAYGGLVRAPLLEWPHHGWINLHFSLLPAWRGAAPVQRAIIAGDERTGATVFQLTEGLDEGAWFARLEEPIGAHRTAGAQLERLSLSGAALTARVVDEIAAGTAVARPQTGQVSLAPKLTRDDARIRWVEPVESVHARIRGVPPAPGAFAVAAGSDAVLKVLEAAPVREAAPLAPGRLAIDAGRVLVGTSSTPLELLRVQPAGKPGMPAADWARGLDLAALPVFA